MMGNLACFSPYLNILSVRVTLWRCFRDALFPHSRRVVPSLTTRCSLTRDALFPRSRRFSRVRAPWQRRGLVDALTEPRRRIDGASSTHGWSLVDAWMEPRRCIVEVSSMQRRFRHIIILNIKGEKFCTFVPFLYLCRQTY